MSVRTALIVGASRGLGLGLACAYGRWGWRVIATQRTASAGLAALAREIGDQLVVADLDVTDEAALAALRERMTSERLDLLFVAAGISHDRGQVAGTMAPDVFARVMLTNALAPMRVIEAFAENVAPEGTVAAMTSGLGSVAGNTSGGLEAYRASKAALNTLLRSFSARHPERCVVALHPGWVRTDMGGADAVLGVDESVAGMVETLARRGGTPGCTFLDYAGHAIPW